MKSKKQRAQERLDFEEKIRKEQLEKLFSPHARSTYKKNDMAEFKKLLYTLSSSYPITKSIDYKIQGVYTSSFNNGSLSKRKGSKKGKPVYCREHNNRDEEYTKTQKHIKQNGTGAIIIDGEFYDRKDLNKKLSFEECDYIIIKDESLEDAYTKNFSEAIEKYNKKQKRKDRRINGVKGYMRSIRKNPQSRLVYESIAQIGNKQAQLPDQKKGLAILMEFLSEWEKRNPNLYIVGAYYHRDEEGAPHLHIDYIPISRNRYARFESLKNEGKTPLGDNGKPKTRVNGLDVENSLTEALDQMGYKNYLMDPEEIEAKFGFCINEKKYSDPSRQKAYDDFLASRKDKNGNPIKTRLVTRQMQWENDERIKLNEICQKYGVRIVNPKDHEREHMDTPAFKLQKETENAKQITKEAKDKLVAAEAIKESSKKERESLNEEKQTIDLQKELIDIELESLEKNKRDLGSDYFKFEIKEAELKLLKENLQKEKKKYEDLDNLFQKDAGQTANEVTEKILEEFMKLKTENQNIESLQNLLETNLKDLFSDTLKRAYGMSNETSKVFGMHPSKIKTKDDIEKCIINLTSIAKKMENDKTLSIHDYLKRNKKTEHKTEGFGLSDQFNLKKLAELSNDFFYIKQ